MPSDLAGSRNALTINNLSHRYGDRDALKAVSFCVATGSIFALLGPNGGGKTTLFRIVTTLMSTSPGGAAVFGRDVAEAPADVRRRIGVMFQSPALDAQLTVRENLACHGNLYHLRGRALVDRIATTLSLVGLEDRADDDVWTLSGGLQRRVELAKALLPEPQLLILDEPSTGLDPGARREIWDHLVRLRDQRGTTVVLTTHLMDEASRVDQVGVLHEGRLVALGAPDDLVADIGGDVILIEARELETLATNIRERFRETVEILEGHLRIEHPCGHEFVTDLVEAFPRQIDAVTFGKPTLEDVFLHHTGQRFS